VALLDQVLPEWQHRERHEIEVDAPPERVWAALHEASAAEMPLLRRLFRLRGLPAGGGPLLGQMQAIGFRLVAEEPGRELVLAAAGRPWRLRERLRPLDDAPPDAALMAFDFRLTGRTLSTETRVALADPRSRRSFRRYWLLVRPFSGLVRRSWLAAIGRRALSNADTQGSDPTMS
jgi:hypothetical protein